MTTRKKYSKEFKLDAISLIVDQGFTRADASRSRNIQPSPLTRWIEEQEADGGQALILVCAVYAQKEIYSSSFIKTTDSGL